MKNSLGWLIVSSLASRVHPSARPSSHFDPNPIDSCTDCTPSLSKNCVNVFVTNPKFLESENRTAGGNGDNNNPGTRITATTAPAIFRSKSGG